MTQQRHGFFFLPECTVCIVTAVFFFMLSLFICLSPPLDNKVLES